jgi:RHS repeat-associated protein
VLEFDVTNTGTGGAGSNQMAVSLGSAYSETFALLTGQQIPRVQRAFTVATQQNAQLVFDHSGIADDGAGLRIDNVLLYRVAGYTSPPGDFSVLARNADGTFTRTLRDGSRVEFDTSGFETALVDRYGNATTFAYSNGRVASITDPAGRATTFDYVGSAVMIAHPPSPSPMRETVLMLDSAGDLRDIVLPQGVQWSFEYDQHRMTSEINPRGYVALHDYDFAGRLLAAYPPNGAERIAANGQSVGLVDPASGLGTPANPAPVRRPTDAVSGIEDGEGRITMFETGPLGSTTEVTDEATGLQTSIARDAAANPTQVQLPSGHTVIRSFDRGQPATIRDVALNPTGQTTLTYHPKFAEVESITDSLGTWNPVYNGLNDPDGPEGSLERIESPLGRTTEFEFSQAPLPPEAPRPGLLRAITDRLGTRTELAYDAFGNLAEIRQGVGLGPALERVTTLTHTPEGYVDQITDAEAGLTDFDYDDLGPVVFQTLPGGREIDLELDDAGNLLGLTPPEGLPRHTFRYDGADREEEYLPPIAFSGARTTRFRYNREDQLTGVDRADSLSVDVAYDASGRVDALETSEGIYDFVYSPTSGLLTSVSAPNAGGSGLAFGYLASSSLPNAVTWTGPVAGTVSWEYDLDGRLDTQTIGGVPLGFGYDADGLLTSAGALTIVRNVQTGFVETASVGSVTTTTGAPNPFGELVVEETTYQSQQPALYRLEIPVRDRLGRILEKRETLAGVETVTEYSYDAAQRLATVTIDGVPTRTWTYDQNGNRQLAGGPVAVYDVQDRLLSLGATTYAYSNHGDLASKTDASGTTTYDFDELGNLHSVDRPAPALPIDYVIDAANRRVGKRVNGTLVKGWLYQDGLRVVAELDGASNVVSRFVYGTKPNVPEYMVQGTTTYRIVSDHLGSVRLVVNTSTGVIAQRIDYDEWGVPTYVTGAPDFQPFGFAGGLHDPDTGLVRFGARDYEPTTGRWTSKDPTRFDGKDSNLYAYVSGDPLNAIDPTGLRMNCVQLRDGIRSTLICHDSTDGALATYPLTEPAANFPSDDPYGPGGQLAAGVYGLLPRPAPGGPTLRTGAPLYTTPGRAAGVVVDPSGRIRRWLGPHVGAYSLGCPLFPRDQVGRKLRDDFYLRFARNVTDGGTTVVIIDVR